MKSGKTIAVDVSNLLLSDSVIYEAMGYGSVIPDEETCLLTSELLQRAKEVAQPLFYYTIQPCTLGSGCTTVGSTELGTGKIITTLLKRSTHIALFVATAGEAFQAWLDEVSQSGDAIRMFVLDAIGSSIVEAAGDYLEVVLQAEIGELKHTNRFSPGYCGWNIVEQHKFFALLPKGVCNITLTDTALMHPIKSISGVIGVGEEVITRKYGCSICKNTTCYLRKK